MSLGIIHGDIKPQNVLIFEDQPGRYTAKVMDFGYSTLFSTEKDLINMPLSWPWAAPEWHHRGFLPSHAMKMDVYSIGLLCLWLLCKDALTCTSLTLSVAVQCEKCTPNRTSTCKECQMKTLSCLKSEGKLCVFANLVLEVMQLEDERKDELDRFFSVALAHHAETRPNTRDLANLLRNEV